MSERLQLPSCQAWQPPVFDAGGQRATGADEVTAPPVPWLSPSEHTDVDPATDRAEQRSGEPPTLTSVTVDAVQQAHDAGVKAGFEAGGAAVREAFAADFAQLCERLSARVELDAEAMVDSLLGLARRLASARLRHELEGDHPAQVALLRECLSRLPSSSAQPVVRLHPVDAAVFAPVGALAGTVTIVADDSLARTDAVLESGASRMDASVEELIRLIDIGAHAAPIAQSAPSLAADVDERSGP